MSSKIGSIIKFPVQAFKNPRKLLKTLLAFSIETESIEDYNHFSANRDIKFIDLIDVIPDFDQEIKSFSFLEGTSRITDIALLMSLAKRVKDCDYLEIGSWRGESLLNVSRFCRKATSLSLSKSEMESCGFSKEAAEADGYFIKDISNLERILHNSLTFDFSTLNRKFDLIFVDGDHRRDAVVSDTKNVFNLLKDENSIIVWHDAGNTYNDIRHEVMAGILEAATAEQRKHIYRVSNTLCAIYINGAFIEMKGNNYIPKHVFDVQLKLSNAI